MDGLELLDRNREPVSLRDHWAGVPGAFLVCGGPSYRSMKYSRLAERGVASLGVNNVCGDVPVSAFCCSDPPRKFCDGIWRDPKILKFAPDTKMRGYRAKLRRKEGDDFVELDVTTVDCPSVYFFRRDLDFEPHRFFDAAGAFWGVNDDGSASTHRPKLLFTFFLGVRLLHYLGVRKVFMLGVDFWMDPAKGRDDNYGFGQRREAGAVITNNEKYVLANEMLRELKPHFDRDGFEVYNCNEYSRCPVFDYVPFDEAVDFCKQYLPKEPFDLQDWYQSEEWLEGRRAKRAGLGLDSCRWENRGRAAGKRAEWIEGWNAG